MPVAMDRYELTLKNVINWVASGALIVGGIIPYVPQYKEIKRKEDAEGFSLYVCLTLLIANTLRILFWFVPVLYPGTLICFVLFYVTFM